MGSILMEPVDLEAHGGLAPKKFTKICMPLAKLRSHGFFESNPLDFSFSLLLFQLFISSAVILIVARLLKPFRQPLFVSQVLGGIVLGPSLLGLSSKYTESIFPLRGFILLDAFNSLGFMFFFFLVGVQVDPWIIKKIDKNAFFIGVSTFGLSIALSTGSSFLLTPFVDEEEVAKSLQSIAHVESVLSFPMIAYFLAELRILNSEFGRVALSSSVVATFCSIAAMFTSIMVHRSGGEKYKLFQIISYSIALGVSVLVIGLVVMWILKRNPDGEPLRQDYITMILLAVLVTGFCSHAMGLGLQFGPLILGITLPAGAPVGSALVEKLDLIIFWVFMPLYFAKIGLLIDIFAVELKHYFIILCVLFMAAIGKFTGAFLSSIRCQMPKRDAISLGLVMTFHGVVELGLFKLMRNNKAIDNGSFVILCIFSILVAGIITPIIRNLYDPSRKYSVYDRRTVMHSKPNTELRILVCIHDQENVPTAINFIEALNPTKQTPITVSMLHLIELVGRANSLLIPHIQTNKTPSSKVSPSEQIVKAFKNLERSSCGTVSVFPFTSISPSETMHDDVCSIALDKRTCLIMVAFHNRFYANGTVGSPKMSAKIANQNVFDNSPCSIAIVVDRGILKTSRYFLESWSSYRVAILFLGGDDDREALALGARMAGHPCISLTIIRLLANRNTNDNIVESSSIDNKVVDTFRSNMAGNYRVMYREEVVMDGAGTVAVIRSMEDQYQLVMVGKCHDNRSPLMSGLTVWGEHKELGPIGDVLATADFMGNTTILVVQQHGNLENESIRTHEGTFSSRNWEDKVEDSLIHRIV